MYRFLTLEEVTADQLLLLERYGGGFPGILNQGRLESAVYAPQATFGGEFLHNDLFAMAAAYLTYLVSGHAFANGNKRIGLSSALRFLYVNGVIVRSDDAALVELVLDVIAHGRDGEAVAEFFRIHGEATESGASLDTATEWLNRSYAPALQKLAE